MPDLNNPLLLMQLLQSYAGQGQPGRDPFSPVQAGVSPEDANAAVAGTAGGGELSPESRAWADQYAKELGVNPEDLTKPASGEIAKQLGVEGVTPDYAGLKTMMLNITKGHEQAGPSGHPGAGGQAPENPQLRQALAYQALQANAKNLGGIGGQMIGNLSPLLAPRMVGPYLEQQQAAASQKASLEMQMKLAETASRGVLRAAQTRKALADEEMSQAKMLHLGDKKYKLNGTPSTGGFLYDPTTGDVQRIEPSPNGRTLTPPKPFNKQDKDGNTYRYSYKTYDDLWSGAEPDRKDLVKPAGSAAERKDLAELYTLADKSLKRVQDLYEDGFTGPVIGRALSARKTGNAITQPLGNIVSQGLLAPDKLAKALEFRAEVENANQALNLFFTGKASSEPEWNRRRAALGLMTDYGADFLSSMASSQRLLQERRAEKERLLGVNILTGEPVDKKPLQSRFIGAPATNKQGAKGVLVDKYVDELSNDYGLQ